MRMNTWKGLAAAAALSAVVAGGVGIARAAANHTSPAPTIALVATRTGLTVTGDDAVRPGWTHVTATNPANDDHAIELVRLHAGVDVDALRTALESPDGRATFGLVDFVGGADDVPHHKTFSMTAHLEAGHYALVDQAQGPEGPNGPGWFTRPGFIRVFNVSGDATDAQSPLATTKISTVDFAYRMPAVLPRHGVVEVHNLGGELHMAAMIKLAPGVSIKRALAIIGHGKQPRGKDLEFFGLMSPGRKLFFDETLAPGNYVIACFMPDLDRGGAPHAAFGMVSGFTVR